MIFFYYEEDGDHSEILKRKQDAFLDVYSLYRATRLPLVKEELMKRAYELGSLDPDFIFDI